MVLFLTLLIAGIALVAVGVARRARDTVVGLIAEGGPMAIVVTRELRNNLFEDFGPGDPVSGVKAVHAAPADADPLGLPDARTFCGVPTADMELLDYQPAGPAESWLPPNMTRWECSGCADALRSL
ncbi:hypothetical protein ABZZ47_43665 [Streptomyces sp. NPDC006465]|uniref:hypothetical protein n=1 Tax=Streptomyces sp. NPDC006465 TaxID=3157174 RepID=UPI0033AFC993